MAINLNQIVLAGRLTRDPEPSLTKGGTTVAKFGLAYNQYRKGSEPRAHYFEVTSFGGTADFVNEYLTKGSLVIVSGELAQDRWQDADGTKRYKVYVIARSVQSASPKEKEPRVGDDGVNEVVDVTKHPDDDIPF